jgi:hypothetical protein
MIYRQSLLGIPLAQRRNRRWIVAFYWAMVASLTGVLMATLKAHPHWPGAVWFIFVWVSGFIGVNSVGHGMWEPRPDGKRISGGIRTLFDPAYRTAMRRNPPLDERERRQRDEAFRSAYSFLVLLAIAGLAAHASGALPRTAYFREPVWWLMVILILNLP